MRFSKHQAAILALIGSNIIWGASAPIFKWALIDIEPFTFAFIRFLLASIILLPFTIHKLKISRHDAVTFFVLAFVGFFIHISLFLFGLSISSSINAPIIASSAPVFLIIGSILFLKEKVKKRILIGTLVSLLGVGVIILRPIFDHGLDGTILGNLFFLLGTIAFVVYTLLLKDFTIHHTSSTVTFYLFAFAAIIFFPFFLWENASHNLLAVIDTRALIGILFAAIFTSCLGYLFYNFGIRYIKASETGVFLYIDPIVTVLIAVPLLHEYVTTSFLLGSLFVFLGIFIAEKRIPYHPLHRLFRK